MNLIKRNGGHGWDPWVIGRDFEEDLGRFFLRPFGRHGMAHRGFDADLEVKEETDRFVIKADVPGVKKEDLDIRVEGKRLVISGEKKQEKEVREKDFQLSERVYGVFARTLELSSDIKASEVKAAIKDGVLEVILPKAENAKTKQVQVEVK